MIDAGQVTYRSATIYVLVVAWFLVANPATSPAWLFAAGIAVSFGGMLLRIWATGFLHKNQEITIGGPYRFVRDPMYLGSLMIASGFMLASHDIGLLALFLVIYFFVYMPRKRRREGERLLKKFGDAYARYAAEVHSLLPRLHPYTGAGNAGAYSFRQSLHNNEHGTILIYVLGVAYLLASRYYWHHALVQVPAWMPNWV